MVSFLPYSFPMGSKSEKWTNKFENKTETAANGPQNIDETLEVSACPLFFFFRIASPFPT